MQQITDNVFVETTTRGCNYGFVRTSAGVVLIDSPFSIAGAAELRDALAGYGELRYTILTEPHPDHWFGHALFDAPMVANVGSRKGVETFDLTELSERYGWPASYRPRLPDVTFTERLTLYVGDHTLELITMPGHTPYQTTVVVREESVAFTTDNLFNRVHTWLQEADPERWLESLEAIRALDQTTLVPGHGAVCDNDYLDEQAAWLGEWEQLVRGGIAAGLDKTEIEQQALTEMLPRFPMDVGLDARAPSVMRANVANLYDFVRREGIHAPQAGSPASAP